MNKKKLLGLKGLKPNLRKNISSRTLIYTFFCVVKYNDFFGKVMSITILSEISKGNLSKSTTRRDGINYYVLNLVIDVS